MNLLLAGGITALTAGLAYAFYEVLGPRRCERCRTKLLQYGPGRPNWWYCLRCGADYEYERQ
jgi:hypothetical protein